MPGNPRGETEISPSIEVLRVFGIRYTEPDLPRGGWQIGMCPIVQKPFGIIWEGGVEALAFNSSALIVNRGSLSARKYEYFLVGYVAEIVR